MAMLSPDEPKRNGRYPEDFRSRVKACFPDSKALYDALDTGNASVGNYLEVACSFTMTPETIVAIFEAGNERAVYDAAKKSALIRALYSEWSLYCQK